MKRTTLVITFVIAAAVIASGQTNNQPAKQDGKTEQEIRTFHRELIEAHKRRDRAALERMITDGFIFIHSTGNWETRQEYIENAAAGTLMSQSAEFEDWIMNCACMKGTPQWSAAAASFASGARTLRGNFVGSMCMRRSRGVGDGSCTSRRG